MEKQKFTLIMNQLAHAIRKYAPDFTDKMNLQIWYSPLKDISDSKLEEACNFAIENLDEFPSIAWLIRKCKGTSRSDKEIGQDIATRIEAAIGKYGYTNPLSAMDHIGPLGWRVVDHCGGWLNICNIEDNSDLPSWRKRWREIGEIVSKNFHERGEHNPPQLPESQFSAIKFIEAQRIN